MDKKSIIILIVIIVTVAAAVLTYVLSGKKLNKRIIRSKVSSVSVTCRRKTVTFSDDININRFCDASGSIRLRPITVPDNSLNGKSGGSLFISFNRNDGTVLDLCFSGDFTFCRIGAAKWYRVINPEKARLLKLYFDSAKKEKEE